MKCPKLLPILLCFLLTLTACDEKDMEAYQNYLETQNITEEVLPQEHLPDEVLPEEVEPLPEEILPQEPLPENSTPPDSKGLIVIDAGHQLYGNFDKEPIGPGATEYKTKVAAGTTGTTTGIPEYVLTLEVALMLEQILLDMGFEVVQIRSTHDVDISNAERAVIANELKADAFLRIHGNGFSDPSAKGAFTLCPSPNNPYCSNIYAESRLLSELVLDGMIQETGAYRRSIQETDSMTGINWCQVPVTIVEMGFMTNPQEDVLLATEEYRYSMALGMALGVEAYIQARSQ